MAADSTSTSGQMLYGLDDVPKPFPKAFGLGLQHVLTMFGATVAVPLLLGGPFGMDMEPAELAILVSAVMVASGVATFLQVTVGTRLPLIQGVSFAFLGPFFAIIAATAALGNDITMQFIAGAIIAGAIVEAIIGYSGLFGVIRRFITPVTIGPVIMLIGLALFQVGAPQAGLDWNIALIVIVGTFLFALVLAPRIGFFKLFPILLAVLVAYAVALVLSLVGVFGEGHPSNVNFAGVGEAPWLRLWGEGGVLFPWGMPQFHLGFILGALAGYLASMIESFGDYFAVARAAGTHEPTEQQINRGIGAEGIGCALSGVFGGFSSTSYSENIGLVAVTKVASRYVVLIGAAILVVLGLVAKFGAVVATVPAPIVGGLYCTLFGLIAAIGMQAANRADLDSHRNLLIMGFILFMGLSVPAFFGGVEALGFAPHEITLGPDWFREMIQTIGSTGMAVAAILGVILDNVIPGTDAERGIAGPPGMAPTEVSEFPAE